MDPDIGEEGLALRSPLVPVIEIGRVATPPFPEIPPDQRLGDGERPLVGPHGEAIPLHLLRGENTPGSARGWPLVLRGTAPPWRNT